MSMVNKLVYEVVLKKYVKEKGEANNVSETCSCYCSDYSSGSSCLVSNKESRTLMLRRATLYLHSVANP